jgi:hypothetical protein
VHPNVFHDVLDLIPVSGWQIVQRADGLTVLVSGVRGDFSETSLVEALRHSLAEQGAMAPVKIERVASIPRGTVGKVALIKSELPPHKDGG